MKIIKKNIEYKGKKYYAIIEIGVAHEKITLYQDNEVVVIVVSHDHGFCYKKADFLSLVIETVKEYAEKQEKLEMKKEEMCRELIKWNGVIE